MSPVFPFDVGVIVFIVRTRTCKLDRVVSFSEIVVEEMIDEFTAVVKVDAEDGKRERIFHILDLSGDFCETFAVSGALLRPVGGDVDRVGGKGINTVYGGTAMSDGIGFQESRFKFIPLVGFDRDVMFEEKSWLGGAAAFTAVEFSNGAERAVDRGGRDSKELL